MWIIFFMNLQYFFKKFVEQTMLCFYIIIIIIIIADAAAAILQHSLIRPTVLQSESTNVGRFVRLSPTAPGLERRLKYCKVGVSVAQNSLPWCASALCRLELPIGTRTVVAMRHCL